MTADRPIVLYVSPWEREGGLAIYSQYLVPQLRDRCDVHVYPWDSESLFVRGTGVLLLTGAFLARLRDADVVHVQYAFGRYIASLPLLLVLGILFRTPVTITQHERFDNLPLASAVYLYHQVIYFLVDRILVHTDTRRDLAWDVHRSRISTVPHGVIHRPDVDRQPTDVETILFPGIIRSIKGHLVAIEAMQYVDSATLRIVGSIRDEEHFAEMQDRIRELGLEDRIEVVAEFVPEEELFEELQRADLVVLPYDPDTSMSGMLSHCISWRVPTLLTDCPAFRSVVPCDAAFFPDRTGAAIGACIGNVQHDMERQAQIIEAFEQLSREYSWDSVAEQTAAVYHT